MSSLSSFILLGHLLGLAMAVGVGAAKVMLLIKCFYDHSLLPAYIRLAGYMTKLLIAGFALVTVTGVAWIALGYSVTSVLWIKIVLVVAVWLIGPYIDNVVEPVFSKLAPKAGEQATPEFIKVQKKHLALEVLAEGLFIVIIFLWVLA